jgi:hypothetical protein
MSPHGTVRVVSVRSNMSDVARIMEHVGIQGILELCIAELKVHPVFAVYGISEACAASSQMQIRRGISF